MSTSFTSAVQSGELTDLRAFALKCARAFTAESTDGPGGGPPGGPGEPVPAEVEPDVSAQDAAIASAEQKLAELSAMDRRASDDGALAAHTEAMREWTERQHERNVQKLRYLAMIQKVEAWSPPTAEHEGLKHFMLRQLHESIRTDCAPEPAPAPQTGAQWRAQELARAQKSADRAARSRAKEIERTSGVSQWLAKLDESLPAEEVVP